jgi:hypothetical protein
MSLSKEDEAAKTMEFLKRNQEEKEKAESYQIHKVFPRKIYLREKGELTMQLVGIASGGQPYESSHNCFNGVKPTHDYGSNSDDEVIVDEYDSMPNNSPRMSSYRSSKPHKKSTIGGGGSMIWRRPPANETY